MKRTPFYHQFLAAGATMAPVQGWAIPDEVAGNRAEHLAVRSAAGLFDWSSTGEIEVAGPHALALVQRVIVNDAARLPVGRVLYTTMCRPDGAIFSDITVYRLDEQRFWLMTAWGSNAAGARPEFDWLNEHAAGMQVCVTDVSPAVALLAVQGPAAAAIVGQLTPADLTELRTMDFIEAPLVSAPRALISRTGYTGELGYELCFPPEYAADIWDALLAAGRPHGLQPAGLKAAFSLRMEKGYIMRFDFMDGVTPFEAGLGWTVKLDGRGVHDGDFIGRDALARQKAAGIPRKLVLVALADADAPLPATGCPVWHAGETIGKVTSSAYGHTVGAPLALALLPAGLAQVGLTVEVEIGDARHPAQVVRRPYYDPEGKRLR